MKLKLYGLEVFEVVRRYPEFVLDSKEYPELELEMEAVAEADFVGDKSATSSALEDLYCKMYETQSKGSIKDTSQDIMSLVGAFDDQANMVEDFSDNENVFRLSGVDYE